MAFLLIITVAFGEPRLVKLYQTMDACVAAMAYESSITFGHTGAVCAPVQMKAT